ncbi:MAG TPA: phosphatidate cytidylyltransferase [Saprospirales bacterium]|nr:phosphatidate cytidylyltransferase [Saprospirales bacterium]
MRQRTITAFFFALIMLGGIYGGPHTLFILFGLVTSIGAWELGSLVFKQEEKHVRLRILLVTLLTTSVYVWVGGDILHWWTMNPFLATALIPVVFGLLATTELFLAGKTPFPNLGIYFLSVFYLAIPLILLLMIAYGETYYPNRVLGLLMLVWTNDTGAYLFGRKFGKNKLFERISPNKTWEGTLGGAFFALMIAWGLSYLIPDFTRAQWLALSVVAALGSNIGDLVESMLKRSVAVKDSGSLMPGHGGILDRFDAFVFCLPFYWLVLQMLS